VRAGAAKARVSVVLGSGAVRSTRLRFQPTDAPLEPAEAPPDVHPQAPLSSITLHQAVDGPLGSNAPTAVRTLFALNNAYGHRPTPELPGGLRVRLLHPVATRSHPLWRTLSEAVRSGRAQAAVDLLRPVLGADLQDLLYLPEGDDGRVGNVHLRYPWGAVPVDVAGDGARALVRIALELAAQPAEVVLIEEPEVHLHPGAIWAVARALLEARRGGVQLILSTHSLELIDALVAQAGPTLDDVAVIRLVLADGNLRAHTIPGAELALLRGELAEELR